MEYIGCITVQEFKDWVIAERNLGTSWDKLSEIAFKEYGIESANGERLNHGGFRRLAEKKTGMNFLDKTHNRYKGKKTKAKKKIETKLSIEKRDQKIIEIFKQNPNKSCKQMLRFLRKHGIQISAQNYYRITKDARQMLNSQAMPKASKVIESKNTKTKMPSKDLIAQTIEGLISPDTIKQIQELTKLGLKPEAISKVMELQLS